ncbi:MFS transporter [Cytobacillus depressus]|uniref:MFS transporter n=1 Tax=Cytobacillus depressus TaxID=1602942 RepID=A0A6L3V544_9BACI|nr:MFS transporter [Cytobacillus depressus]KAB2336241.1 MFS transporter [Cytobacillus depressus]
MRWRIVIFLFIGMVINFADKMVAGYAAVPIMEEFNLSYTQWGLLSSSFFWLFMISGIFGSALSDRIGTRNLLTIMLLAWSVIQSGAFLVTGVFGLIIMRVALGAFEGPYSPTSNNHLSKWFKPERLSFAISLVNAGSAVGGLICAPLLVLGIQELGWRQTFGVLGAISLVWVVLWLWLGKEKTVSENAGATEVKTMPVPKLKWSETYPVLLSRPFVMVCLMLFSTYWVLVWTQSFLPAYLVKAVHLTPTEMGNFSSILGAAYIVLMILIAWYSDRLFQKHNSLRKARVMVAGIGAILSGVLFYSMTIFTNPVYILIAMILAKAMVHAVFILWVPIALSLLPERKGLILGVGTGCAQFAGVVGPVVTGFIVQFAGTNEALGFDYSILFMGSQLVLAGLVFTLLCKPDVYVRKTVHHSEEVSAG